MKRLFVLFLVLLCLVSIGSAATQVINNSWSQVAPQYGGETFTYSPVTYNDGTGDALYAGSASNGTLLKYNTTIGGWLRVAYKYGTQTNTVNLVNYNDGTGNAIFAVTYDNGLLLKYNRTLNNWSQVASQYGGEHGKYLITYNDGTGTAIFAGTTSNSSLLKYNTTIGGWLCVANNGASEPTIDSMVVYNDGTGNALFAGTNSNGLLLKYNSTLGNWSKVANQLGAQTYTYSMTTYDDGTGNAIYAGMATNGYLYKYNLTLAGWKQMSGQYGSEGYITSISRYNDGTGDAVYGGTYPGGLLLKYNASVGAWTQVASQINSQTQIVGLVQYSPNGLGNSLYGTTYPNGKLFKYDTYTVSPITTFSSNVTSGYSIVPVQFNETSASTGTSWIWNATNVTGNNTAFTFSNAQNSTYSFPIGNFSISLNSTNAGGSNVSAQKTFVNVSAPPPPIMAGFALNTTVSYQYPMPVSITDTSTGSPVSWNYSFGDTYYSNLQNPTHIYTVANNYTVTLNVTNSSGAYNIATNYTSLETDDDIYLRSWMQFENATVTDLKGNAWTAASGATVSPTTKKFGSQSLAILTNDARITSPSSSVWDRSPAGGEMEFWINITSLGDAGKPLIKRSTGGSGTSDGWGLYNINGTAYGYSWWWGNSATNHTAGFYIPMNTWTHVVLTRNSTQYWTVYKNGIYQTSINVGGVTADTVNAFQIGADGGGTEFYFYLDEFRYSEGVPRFVSNFDVPFAAYNGNLYTNYTNINPNATMRYKTNPETIAYNYNQTGARNRTIQIQNITNATSITVGINYDPMHLYAKPPVVNTTDYSDSYISAYSIDSVRGTEIVTISRDLGFQASDGTRINLFNAPMLYYNYTTEASFDSYFTYATITDGQHSATYPIYNFILTPIEYGMWGNPIVSFSANTTTPPIYQPVQFTDISGNYPTGWSWDFGDGTTSTLQNPVHSYSSIGYKNVTLLAYLTANTSITNTSTVTSYINVGGVTPPAPIIAYFNATPTIASVGYPVSFTAIVANNPTTYSWSFGDGTSSSLASPTHIYTSIGVYNVSLVVSNSGGSATSTRDNYVTITALSAPSASFTQNASVGVSPQVVQFTDTSSGVVDNHLWTFGDDGTLSTDANPVHTFTALGNWTVTENVSNSAGNSTATGYVLVRTYVGENKQDITMDAEYTVTFTITDSSTSGALSGVLVSDITNVLSTTTDGSGVGVLSEPFGTFSGSLSKDGYTSKTFGLSVDNDTWVSYSLSISSTTTSSNNVLWSPQNTAIQVLDSNNNPIVGSIVSTNAIDSTLPGGLTGAIEYFQATYGVSAASAASMLSTETTYNGVTDTYGYVAFQMVPIIKYQVSVTDALGYPYIISTYPQSTWMQIRTPNATTTSIFTSGDAAVAILKDSIHVTNLTENDEGTVATLRVFFYDASHTTTGLDCWFKAPNSTVYWQNATFATTAGLQTCNLAVPADPFTTWQWGAISA
jgi:PKD repeat protein